MATTHIFAVIGSLIFIVCLLLAGAWFVRRHNWIGNRSRQIHMQIIGSQSLGARNSIVAVQVNNTCLIVGVTPQNINLLHSTTIDSQSDFAKELGNAKTQI